MQSGQVPLWVPIGAAVVAGLFAVLGTLLGSHLNARREAARERFRAHAELERERLKQQHEIRLRWIDERSSLYEEIIARLEDCRETLDQAHADHPEGFAVNSGEFQEIEGLIDDGLRPLLRRTAFIAPPQIDKKIRSAWEQLVAMLTCLVSELRAHSIDDFDDEMATFLQQQDELVAAMQVDLGITFTSSPEHPPGDS